jgi:hypothetical protein
LSTSGVVSRPAAAVAPLARVARFSSIAGDPTFEGEKMGGKFNVNLSTLTLTFKTKGTVRPAPFAKFISTFHGTATAIHMANGGFLYTNGRATVFSLSLNGNRHAVHIDFQGIQQAKGKLELEGTVVRGEGGVGAGGMFSASGHVTHLGKGIGRVNMKIMFDATLV